MKMNYRPVQVPATVIGKGPKGDPIIRLSHGQYGYAKAGYDRDHPPEEGERYMFLPFRGGPAGTGFSFGRLLNRIDKNGHR